MERNLILMVGLPRSGKSTWAAESGFPVVNRDAIRLVLHGQKYVPEAELMVSAIETYMVKALFLAGHKTVVVDACHQNFRRRDRWNFLQQEIPKLQIMLKIIKTNAFECLSRAKDEGRKDLIPIIQKMNRESDFWEMEGI